MGIIWWLICFLALWTALKFVVLVFKRIGNKNSLNALIDKGEDKMRTGADKFVDWMQTRKKEEKPEVTIH